MLAFIGVVSTILFILGVALYWYFSKPLAALPNIFQLTEEKKQQELSKGNAPE